MDALADRYAPRGVTSAFIYAREAHPAENYRHHSSMDLKRSHARSLRDEAGVRRTILLDDLEGSAHRAFGALPNMTWIVGKRGVILYKASWTWHDDVAHALERALDQLARRRDERLVPFFSQRLAWRHNDPRAFRAALERMGPQAVKDFYGED